jgi:hypothetical protein
MRRSLLLLVTGCGSAPFTSEATSLAGDAGAPVPAETSTSPIPSLPDLPWVGPGPSVGGAPSGGSENSDAGGSPEQSGGAAGEPIDAGNLAHDAGPLPDRLPPEYVSFRESLDASGLSCPALESAVQRCCESPAAVFSCDSDGCKCGAQGYGGMKTLCSVSPATPLQWGCP